MRAGDRSEVGFPLDSVVCLSALVLLSLGLVMVCSASVEMSARSYGNPYYLLIKHSVYVAISVAAGIVALSLPTSLWRKVELPLLLVGFALLIAVLLPGVGREVNGSMRWISLGFFTVQGSEFLKFFVIIYIAGYLARQHDRDEMTLVDFIKPLAVMIALVFLLMVQPDFGAAVVIMGAVLGVIFLAGAPLRYFMPLVAGCIAAAAALAMLQPYRLARLTAFTDPWKHQFDGGYQLTQALIAFGRGDLFGLGLGNSIQKLFFLPEAHTDFLFSILAEELGVLLAAAVVGLFALLVLRILWIGKRSTDLGLPFQAYLAFGASLMLGLQASVNIGVNLGVLPTKGLTLPLMSYGGNSLIVTCLMLGLVLRVAWENGEQAAPVKRRRTNAR